MIIVQATFPASPAHHDAVVRALTRFSAATRRETGCLSCVVASVVEGDRGVRAGILVLQQWRDTDALREHYTSDHLADLLAELQELQVGEIETRRFEVRDLEAEEEGGSENDPSAPRVLH